MNRRVTKFGEKILKEKAEKVSVFDGELKALAADLVDTMYEEKGLGLAAPQIGVSKKVFAIDMRQRVNTDVPCVFTLDGKELPLDLAMPLVAVNPEVEEIGDYVEIADEGCLSFPGVFAEVERSAMVKMRYFDTDGVQHELVKAAWPRLIFTSDVNKAELQKFVDRAYSCGFLKERTDISKIFYE